MDDGRYFTSFCCDHHGNGNEASFGKNDVRLQLFQKFSGFPEAFQYPERIGKILEVEVAPQLSGRYSVIGNIQLLDQFALNAVVGADIGNFVSGFPERGNQSDIRCNVSGSAAAGENDMLHRESSCKTVVIH